MSDFRIWLSIVSWAALAVAGAIGAYRLALWIDPSSSYLLLTLVVMVAVQAVYGLRAMARRLGWARKSYAPQAQV